MYEDGDDDDDMQEQEQQAQPPKKKRKTPVDTIKLKKTLDSARAGQIPAKPSPIRGAMMGQAPDRSESTMSLDRIEGDKAVLEYDKPMGKQRIAPVDSLKNPAEGRIYRDGEPEPDLAEEKRRKFLANMARGRKRAAAARESTATANSSSRIKQAMTAGRRPPG